MRMIPVMVAAVMFSCVAYGAAVSVGEQKQVDKAAFLRAQKAATAPTWTAALLVLKSIDVDKIDDVEVVAYVDFSTRCAQLAEDLGIDRQSDPNNTKKTLAEMDLPKFASTLWEIIQNRGLTQGARVAVEARRIQKQVPMYIELDQKLTTRFSAQQ